MNGGSRFKWIFFFFKGVGWEVVMGLLMNSTEFHRPSNYWTIGCISANDQRILTWEFSTYLGLTSGVSCSKSDHTIDLDEDINYWLATIWWDIFFLPQSIMQLCLNSWQMDTRYSHELRKTYLLSVHRINCLDIRELDRLFLSVPLSFTCINLHYLVKCINYDAELVFSS